MNVSRLAPPPYREEHDDYITRYHQTGEARVLGREREVEGQRKDGSTFPLALRVTGFRHGRFEGFIGVLEDITQRKEAERERELLIEDLKQSQDQLLGLIRHASYGIYRATFEGRFVMVNAALVRMLGYDSERELLELESIEELYEDPKQRGSVLAQVACAAGLVEQEVRWLRKDGDVVTLRLRGHTTADSDGHVLWSEVFVEDVTQERALAEQLRQAKKMEAVGRLAGGIAHDFNNLLTVIIGESELLLRDLSHDSPLRDDLIEIREAGRRASDLTGQLLAFSRKQLSQPSPFNLDELVNKTATMLRRLIGEDIELHTELAAGDIAVLADRSEIEQVLVNLVVNARDAMPSGGSITVSTSCMTMTQAFVRSHAGAQVADYVLLSVRDEGVGMDEDTLSNVFEPFFTTKERGRGTGLGMAMVYGIVKKLDGYVEISSEVGAGTEVQVYLPPTGEEALALNDQETPPALAGSETILLVEDEDGVRRIASQILGEQGYEVIVASDGAEALQLVREHSARIDLLLTDVVMPGLSGRELIEIAVGIRPEMKFLFMSGYTDEDLLKATLMGHRSALVHKPFTIDTLGAAVREALDRPVYV